MSMYSLALQYTLNETKIEDYSYRDKLSKSNKNEDK